MSASTSPRGRDGLVCDLAVADRLQVGFAAVPGSVVAVVGPNGAGKSTLLDAIAGLNQARGSLRVDGREWASLDARHRRVGYALQDRRLFPHLSARDNVAFGPRARGLDRRTARARALEWLDRFGIGDLAARRPHQLSGGQAQRVSIARALAVEPAVLLLDEPFTGLDVTVAAGLRQELRTHLADFAGVTLLVTHDNLDSVLLADRLLVLEAGRPAQYGTREEVSRHPATRHIATMVGLNVLAADRPGETGLIAFSPAAVTLSPTRPTGSARWVWEGSVHEVFRHGDAVRVRIGTAAGEVLADVTAQATGELGLAPGHPVWASVKSMAVRRYDPAAPAG